MAFDNCMTFIFVWFLFVVLGKSNGDVYLTETGLVQLYLGTDGNLKDITPWGLWGTLNGKDSGSEVANTLCRQLGYGYGDAAMYGEPNTECVDIAINSK